MTSFGAPLAAPGRMKGKSAPQLSAHVMQSSSFSKAPSIKGELKMGAKDGS